MTSPAVPDLNALYVGMCRSIGIPARDVYGVRVADPRYDTGVWDEAERFRKRSIAAPKCDSRITAGCGSILPT